MINFPIRIDSGNVIKNKPIKLGKYTMATQTAQNLKKVGTALMGDKNIKRIA